MTSHSHRAPIVGACLGILYVEGTGTGVPDAVEVVVVAVEDRLISLVANFIHTDENALSLDDPLWESDGGPLELASLSEFVDELEGEFGIQVNERDVRDLATLSDLLQLVQNRAEDDDTTAF